MEKGIGYGVASSNDRCFSRNTGQGDLGVLASDSAMVEDDPVCSGRSGLPRMVRREATGSGTISDWRQSLESGARCPNCCVGEFGKRAGKENFDRENNL